MKSSTSSTNLRILGRQRRRLWWCGSHAARPAAARPTLTCPVPERTTSAWARASVRRRRRTHERHGAAPTSLASASPASPLSLRRALVLGLRPNATHASASAPYHGSGRISAASRTVAGASPFQNVVHRQRPVKRDVSRLPGARPLHFNTLTMHHGKVRD
jgi:hypothetical protein